MLCPWLVELFHLYTVTLKLLFSTYELVVEIVECRWYVWMFQLRFKKQLSALCSRNIFPYESKIWLFALYENSFSCSEHIFFFSYTGWKNRLWAFCSHRHVTFLFWSMSWKQFTFFSYWTGYGKPNLAKFNHKKN